MDKSQEFLDYAAGPPVQPEGVIERFLLGYFVSQLISATVGAMAMAKAGAASIVGAIVCVLALLILKVLVDSLTASLAFRFTKGGCDFWMPSATFGFFVGLFLPVTITMAIAARLPIAFLLIFVWPLGLLCYLAVPLLAGYIIRKVGC